MGKSFVVKAYQTYLQLIFSANPLGVYTNSVGTYLCMYVSLGRF